MVYLYMDNYRGFTDTYTPIADVNFLVGENSTGKTSALALLEVLSSPRFWFNQEFNTEEVELGNFTDIVSVKSQNRKRFRVGFLDCAGKSPRAFLLTFKEAEGLPIVYRYDYYRRGKEATVVASKGGIRYKIQRCGLPDDNRGEFVKSIFKKWTRSTRASSGFKKLKGEFPFPNRGWLLFMPGLLESTLPGANAAGEKTVSVEEPVPFGGLAWLAPIRSKARRTYDEFRSEFTAEGEHTPYLVRSLLAHAKSEGAFKTFMGGFGKQSDLFDGVTIKRFGQQPTSPFALNIVLQGKTLNIKNVGYGISQSLPVVVELFARSQESWFAIQQPEIHLHPKAQAALGDIIFSLAVRQKKKFLVETHSDYLVDRFRLNYKRTRKKISSQVLFFERGRSENKIHAIGIEPGGQYSTKQPRGFREFFIREELRLLGLR